MAVGFSVTSEESSSQQTKPQITNSAISNIATIKIMVLITIA